MVLFLDVVVMSVCQLYMHFLCMSVSVCYYACIIMGTVSVHEVILCILGHHDFIGTL